MKVASYALVMKNKADTPARVPREGTRYSPLMTELDVLTYLNVSRTTLHLYKKTKNFPLPILLGGARNRWLLADVVKWVEDQRLGGRREA
jgi:predicted DNA-binding transcriptional regulator AlpA